MKVQDLPAHLQKYIVEQDYNKYTPVDHAVWRFIIRQLKSYLSQHAHESYMSGMKSTGIDEEKIPSISSISEKLEKMGWCALPVSGFIPPAAFMELQSLSVLPIASDMRSLSHLMYTPAPDIVHEAAGHAPMLAHPEFAEYLRAYSQVAKKAIISKQDLTIYECIRILSDLKESPDATEKQIQNAQEKLDQAIKNNSYVSEAAELSRMNWWTAEYGLVGDIHQPKIYGAGLLSSVGESRWCLSQKVKKIPLTVDCIKVSYDITEPQPQLFVAPDFATLTRVLEEMASQMACRTGGVSGLEKAIKAETVNTVQLDSGVQISGLLKEYLVNKKNEPFYIRFEGPCQLSRDGHQMPGHGKDYHSHGYGTPLGKYHLVKGPLSQMNFDSGVQVKGVLVSQDSFLMKWRECAVTWGDHVLFRPEWGDFDLALGHGVASVFAGPADRVAYGGTDDFVAKRVEIRQYSEIEKKRHQLYAKIRHMRESHYQSHEIMDKMIPILSELKSFPDEWLALFELYEILYVHFRNNSIVVDLRKQILDIANKYPEQKNFIIDGLNLVEQKVAH